MIKLSLLVPTIVGREAQYKRLFDSIQAQYIPDWIQVLTEKDNREMSIGAKRNILLQKAAGQYVAFLDDDDRISDNYVKLLMEGIDKGVDCCSLRGVITVNGNDPQVFEHALKYSEWRTNSDKKEVKHERPPNHLNCIKASIAKQFNFPETYHGEDHVWSMAIQKSGLLKTEHYIDEVLYYYDFVTNKNK